MAKDVTWTIKGVTHQRMPWPKTRCGIEVPYVVADKRKKGGRMRRRLSKDRKPRPVTCIDCLAAVETEPMRVLINDPIRGMTADMVFYDEVQDLK